MGTCTNMAASLKNYTNCKKLQTYTHKNYVWNSGKDKHSERKQTVYWGLNRWEIDCKRVGRNFFG